MNPSCKVCGKRVTLPTNKYCSRKCLYSCPKWKRKISKTFKQGRNYEKINCTACKNPFTPRNYRHKICPSCKKGASKSTILRMARYEISREQVEALKTATCELCSLPAQYVDHDHKTGKYRGLLCPGCNMALNRVEQDEWVRRAQKYLKKSK